MTGHHIDLDARNTPAVAVADCIKRFGAVVLRSAVDLELAARIKADLRRIYLMHQAYSNGDPAAASFFDGFDPRAVAAIAEGTVVPAVHEELFGTDASMYAPIAEPQLKEVFALMFVGGRYDRLPFEALATVHPQARPATQANGGISMHTDGAYYDDMLYGLTIWIPLDPCGREAPGLQIVAANHHEVRNFVDFDPARQAPEHPNYNFHKYRPDAFEADRITQHFGFSRIVRPECEPGDMAIFSNWTLHATHHRDDMQRSRSVIQLRLQGCAFDPAPASMDS
jgi:hypothetical protein